MEDTFIKEHSKDDWHAANPINICHMVFTIRTSVGDLRNLLTDFIKF